jgi:hypothetical protein
MAHTGLMNATQRRQAEAATHAAHVLIEAVTHAASTTEALTLVKAASVQERYSAADLLWVEADGHAMPWLMSAIVREARA